MAAISSNSTHAGVFLAPIDRDSGFHNWTTVIITHKVHCNMAGGEWLNISSNQPSAKDRVTHSDLTTGSYTK